jgi:hypothetical protein
LRGIARPSQEPHMAQKTVYVLSQFPHFATLVCVELDRLGERLHLVGDAGVEVSQRQVEAVDVAEQLGDEDTVVGEVEAARQ